MPNWVPELAACMIGRPVPARRALRGLGRGGEFCGGSPKLRFALEERQVGYEFAVVLMGRGHHR
ncbi:hypothetical protein [Streptomyces pseudovenezuelae]|uniref:hypothetical protein n=1 Tax=Streptomyces pseudovenezuelae TaxID=67350 RepID=UPI0039A56238